MSTSIYQFLQLKLRFCVSWQRWTTQLRLIAPMLVTLTSDAFFQQHLAVAQPEATCQTSRLLHQLTCQSKRFPVVCDQQTLFLPSTSQQHLYTGPSKGNPEHFTPNPAKFAPSATSPPWPDNSHRDCYYLHCLRNFATVNISVFFFCRRCFRCVSRSARHGTTSGGAFFACMWGPLRFSWEYGIW